MGFNKRFVGKDEITKFLNGECTLKDLFKADAVILLDETSSRVFKMYQKKITDNEIKSKLNGY